MSSAISKNISASITKSTLRSIFIVVLTGIVLATLFPGLTPFRFSLCVGSIWILIDLAKAEICAKIRADIRGDAEQDHADTRIWLRDWFDPDHRHCVISIPFDPNHRYPWDAWDDFSRRYSETKKKKTNDV